MMLVELPLQNTYRGNETANSGESPSVKSTLSRAANYIFGGIKDDIQAAWHAREAGPMAMLGAVEPMRLWTYSLYAKSAAYLLGAIIANDLRDGHLFDRHAQSIHLGNQNPQNNHGVTALQTQPTATPIPEQNPCDANQHWVQPGQTLGGIAGERGISTDSLAEANNYYIDTPTPGANPPQSLPAGSCLVIPGPASTATPTPMPISTIDPALAVTNTAPNPTATPRVDAVQLLCSSPTAPECSVPLDPGPMQHTNLFTSIVSPDVLNNPNLTLSDRQEHFLNQIAAQLQQFENAQVTLGNEEFLNKSLGEIHEQVLTCFEEGKPIVPSNFSNETDRLAHLNSCRDATFVIPEHLVDGETIQSQMTLSQLYDAIIKRAYDANKLWVDTQTAQNDGAEVNLYSNVNWKTLAGIGAGILGLVGATFLLTRRHTLNIVSEEQFTEEAGEGDFLKRIPSYEDTGEIGLQEEVDDQPDEDHEDVHEQAPRWPGKRRPL